MFRKILVANRGEIAMRVIRACRELNIATAAIYSEADSTGIYVKKADEAYLVGPGPVQGFLDGQQIVDLAKRIRADAIHPGYGFLAENAQFAHLCQASGVTFIGPSPQVIHLMGNKVKARELAQKVGVPIVPGTDGPVSGSDEALAFCRTAGYPVMIKASAGGGGRGKLCDPDFLVGRAQHRHLFLRSLPADLSLRCVPRGAPITLHHARRRNPLT